MRTARSILRCAQKLARASGPVSSSARSASSLAQTQIVEGENGERIITSPFGDVEVPGIMIHEYVWKRMGDYRNHVALECGVTGRKYTYAEARDAANFVAKSLLNLGLKQGDVVAMIAPNYPETILSFLGILEAQLVVTTVNPYYTIDEMARQLKSSGAKAVISAADVSNVAFAAARQAIPERVPVIVIDDGSGRIPEGAIPYQDLITRGKTLPTLNLGEISADSLAVLPYSSGTTGLPKGVMLTHNNLTVNMEMERSTTTDTWHETSETYQEVIPLILPFFHIFGMNCGALNRLSNGARVVTLPKFTPEGYAGIFAKQRVTALFCVPPIVLFLATSSLIKREHLEHVHIALSGAAPLSKPDVERFYDKFGFSSSDMKFCQGYGLTETSPVCFFEKAGVKYSSIGKNVAGCDARVVDPVTNEDIFRPGQLGELWVRGPHVMKGYINDEKSTRETIVEGGWLKTGDIVYFDEDFDFFVTDRMKELIKVKGFQVPPAELEAVLRTHPDVLEAAVIGVPDGRCGEVPLAFVVPKQNMKPSPEDIKNFVGSKVSDHKQLRGGVRIVECIPKNPSGKILRIKLRREYSPK